MQTHLKKNSEKFQNRPGCLRLYDTAIFSIRQQYKGDCRAEVRLLTPISVTQAQILKGFGKPVLWTFGDFFIHSGPDP